MGAGGRRAAARKRQVAGDPYWSNRVLVMNFNDLTDAKGHALTNNLNAADNVSDGALNKNANVANSRLTLTTWSPEFALAADGNVFAIELDALWASGTQNFACGIGVSGGGAWNGTDGNQFYLGRYNGNAVFDHWNGAFNAGWRVGAIDVNTRTRLRVICDGTRMSMYVGANRVITSTSLMVPVTSLSTLNISDVAGGGAAINNGGKLYGLRLTKGSTGGFDPNNATLTDTPLDNL